MDVFDVLAGRRPRFWPLGEATLPLLEGREPDVPEFAAWLHGRRRDLARSGRLLQQTYCSSTSSASPAVKASATIRARPVPACFVTLNSTSRRIW